MKIKMAAALANNINNINNNNNNNIEVSSSDLHEAILANSQSVVELYLEQGADPNQSPQLAPVGVISAAPSERARDLHRTLGRVFRSRQGGSIHPLHVAVCNAYHHAVFGRDEALGIVRALLKAGADTNLTCNGIAFCKVGNHPSVTIASNKTADKVALFLKRFPPTLHRDECCSMMDEVATCILQSATASNDSDENERTHNRANSETLDTWNSMLEDNNYTDIVFKCPDGDVTAHKSVLATAVPYFDAAFQGPWKEGNENNEWRTTNSVSTMQYILTFIYTGKVPDDEEVDLATILAVAAEYQLETLQLYCQEQLIEALSEETISTALSLSHLHNLDKLRDASHDYVHANATTLLVKPDFMSLSTSNPAVWSDLVAGLAERDSTTKKRKRSEDSDSHDSADDATRNSAGESV